MKHITASGREIDSPNIRIWNNLIAKKDSKNADAWLLAETKIENEMNMNETERISRKVLLNVMNSKHLQDADKYLCNLILFGKNTFANYEMIKDKP